MNLEKQKKLIINQIKDVINDDQLLSLSLIHDLVEYLNKTNKNIKYDSIMSIHRYFREKYNFDFTSSSQISTINFLYDFLNLTPDNEWYTLSNNNRIETINKDQFMDRLEQSTWVKQNDRELLETIFKKTSQFKKINEIKDFINQNNYYDLMIKNEVFYDYDQLQKRFDKTNDNRKRIIKDFKESHFLLYKKFVDNNKSNLLLEYNQKTKMFQIKTLNEIYNELINTNKKER